MRTCGFSTGFKGASFLLLLVSVIAVFTSAQALAQPAPPESGSEVVYTSKKGSGYEVFDDGTVIIGGDVVGDCPSLLEDAREVGAEDSRVIRQQVAICAEAGFPPRGSSLPETGVPFSYEAGTLVLVASALGFIGLRGMRPSRRQGCVPAAR